ncbi:TetR/AcrR family transcriptional regulator [Pseudomonas oryzihabitans]|uniref:HTH tetR-type domain-containing protein n=1 Tax=Pseudomonas oryzihabitans TaxID=47885 RepID=A0ABX3ILS6_9PSED|nr:hypothetical protein BVL52_24385 [Pseudomonas psychrotolerans]
MRKTRSEAEKTHRLILKSALILFAKEGIERTTIGMIADRAVISRGAVYWHFKDKDAIATSVLSLAPSPMLYMKKQLKRSESNDTIETILIRALEKYSKKGSDENGIAQILYSYNDLSIGHSKILREESRLSEECMTLIENRLSNEQHQKNLLRERSVCALLLWKAALQRNLIEHEQKVDTATIGTGLDHIFNSINHMTYN